MTRSMNRLFRIALSAVTGIGCLFLSENLSLTTSDSLVSLAQARIGRPLTPMSYAGVARRTTRRAVATGAAVGAAATGTYYGTGCVQVVNAYGQIMMQCQ
jgi:hypothetical protein